MGGERGSGPRSSLRAGGNRRPQRVSGLLQSTRPRTPACVHPSGAEQRLGLLFALEQRFLPSEPPRVPMEGSTAGDPSGSPVAGASPAALRLPPSPPPAATAFPIPLGASAPSIFPVPITALGIRSALFSHPLPVSSVIPAPPCACSPQEPPGRAEAPPSPCHSRLALPVPRPREPGRARGSAGDAPAGPRPPRAGSWGLPGPCHHAGGRRLRPRQRERPNHHQHSAAFCIPLPRRMRDGSRGVPGSVPTAVPAEQLCQRLPPPRAPSPGPPLILWPLVSPAMGPDTQPRLRKGRWWQSRFPTPGSAQPGSVARRIRATLRCREQRKELLCRIPEQNSSRYRNTRNQQLSLRGVWFRRCFQRD